MDRFIGHSVLLSQLNPEHIHGFLTGIRFTTLSIWRTERAFGTVKDWHETKPSDCCERRWYLDGEYSCTLVYSSWDADLEQLVVGLGG